jgi:hypothetical protein
VQWTLVRRSLQRQADSGALAGAYALTQGQDVASTVTADMRKNSNFTLTALPVIENGPTSGPYAGNTSVVRVRIDADSRLPFTGVFLGRATNISVEATAGLQQDGEYCIVALDTGNSLAITNSGNTTVNAACGMHANSTGDPAINGQGSAVISASPVSAVGNVDNRSSNFAAGTVFQPYMVAQRDPLAAIANPSFTSSPNNSDVRSGQTRNMTPGTYRGMSIQGTANLAPGTYIIDGARQGNGNQNNGGLSIGSQAVVNGGATMNITAPLNGTYKGVLVFQDRRATLMGNQVQINGNSSSKLEGAIYVPRNEIQMNGTTNMNIRCLQLIGYRFVFTGNSQITNVCPANTGSGTFKGNIVRLLN